MISFPATDRDIATPEETGFSSDALYAAAASHADRAADEPYRILVSRHGKIVGEWERGHDNTYRAPLAGLTAPVRPFIPGVATNSVVSAQNDSTLSLRKHTLDNIS